MQLELLLVVFFFFFFVFKATKSPIWQKCEEATNVSSYVV